MLQENHFGKWPEGCSAYIYQLQYALGPYSKKLFSCIKHMNSASFVVTSNQCSTLFTLQPGSIVLSISHFRNLQTKKNGDRELSTDEVNSHLHYEEKCIRSWFIDSFTALGLSMMWGPLFRRCSSCTSHNLDHLVLSLSLMARILMFLLAVALDNVMYYWPWEHTGSGGYILRYRKVCIPFDLETKHISLEV